MSATEKLVVILFDCLIYLLKLPYHSGGLLSINSNSLTLCTDIVVRTIAVHDPLGFSEYD